jgi:hypothetical protein
MFRFFRSFAKSFGDVTRRYKNPTIKPTKVVVISLLILRIYLLGMVILLVISFIANLKH